MSVQPCFEPLCESTPGAVELLIEPRRRDLGGFGVRRVLPAPRHRMVGPFIFFDEMGPAEFPPGQGIDVRPHPHIGIATITYLFDGEIIHRDSLGYTQPIRPGAVNLMTAGRGIVHSERAGRDRDEESTLHGIQSWIALPREHEEMQPAFEHYPAAAIPEVVVEDVTVRVILGAAYGTSSPVETPSPALYFEARLPAGAQLSLPDATERGAYIVAGALDVDGERYVAGTMVVLASGRRAAVTAAEDARIMVVGGEPVGQRTIWWNFVSSRPERIEQAKDDWRSGRFEGIDGDDEFIPLPES